MSPSQSPSSMYSHAPTVIHHSAHRSALARRATRQLSKWTESSPQSPSTHDHHHHSSTPSPRLPPISRSNDYSYTYNGNYSAEYKKPVATTQTQTQQSYRNNQHSPYHDNGDDDEEENEMEDDHSTSVQSQSGPTVRKYAELNFHDDGDVDDGDAIGFAQVGRREKIGGEWGTPESALAGIGRQATKIIRAATASKKGSSGGGVGLGLGNVGVGYGNYGREGYKGKGSISPSNSIGSKASSGIQGLGARSKIGDLLSTTNRRNGAERDFLSSGSKVSVSSDQSRETSTTRTSSSESSVGEAIITPNHSSAFTPFHENPHHFNTAIKYTYPSRSTTSTTTTNAAVPSAAAAAASAYRQSTQAHITPTLAPSAQIFDSSTSTNNANLSPANFSLSPAPSSFTASDRPLMSSGSPGFGLISLEDAQERERVRLGGPTPKSSSSSSSKKNIVNQSTPRQPAVPPIPSAQNQSHNQKVRNKKSLISLFRSATSYASGNGSGNAGGGAAPPVPGFSMVNTGGNGKKMNIGEPLPLLCPTGEFAGQRGNAAGSRQEVIDGDYHMVGPRDLTGENQLRVREQQSLSAARNLLPGPKLELRPVSMMLANGLPEDYLASSTAPSTSDSANNDDAYADGRSSVFTTTTASLSSATSSILGPDDSSEILDSSSSSSNPEVLALRKEIANLRKTHQYQQSELSSQVRELRDALQGAKKEMEDMQAEKERWGPREDGCAECGCTCGMAVSEMLMGSAPSPRPTERSGGSIMSGGGGGGVMGRARSGTTSRSVRSVKSTKSTVSGRGGEYAGIPIPTAPLPDRTAGSRGVMDRARVKTGGARGVFGTGSLYEWE